MPQLVEYLHRHVAETLEKAKALSDRRTKGAPAAGDDPKRVEIKIEDLKGAQDAIAKRLTTSVPRTELGDLVRRRSPFPVFHSALRLQAPSPNPSQPRTLHCAAPPPCLAAAHARLLPLTFRQARRTNSTPLPDVKPFHGLLVPRGGALTRANYQARRRCPLHPRPHGTP